jgi:D-glycero-D-manno-heptose 1,7-bisphosphate phosphatase
MNTDERFDSKYKRRAIFLDRDGVINKQMDSLHKVEDFKLLSGVVDAVKKINKSKYLVIIITNQPDIAKGFCTFEDMDKIHEKMKGLLYEKGAHIDDIYICPHHPEKGFEGEVKELKIECECRKPKPGLLLKAIKEHNIDSEQSWMIGDSKMDVAAGQRAGLKTIFLRAGGGSGSKEEKDYENIRPDFIKKDLKEAVDLIFK